MQENNLEVEMDEFSSELDQKEKNGQQGVDLDLKLEFD